jgi:hypothetical protein
LFKDRRALLALGGALGLSGCGFRPLYAPITAEDGSTADIRDDLAAVRVGNVPERSGQLLRRDLQRRFEGVRLGVPARYTLQVAVTYAAEPLGYRRDGTITRLRYFATGSWNPAPPFGGAAAADRGLCHPGAGARLLQHPTCRSSAADHSPATRWSAL